MIISHKYKFIFVKTFKTAGTSIEAYLSEFCGPLDVLTEIIPPIERHHARNSNGFYNHMPAWEIQGLVETRVWNSYTKFCVERNPCEKVLSYYWMEKKRRNSRLEFDEFLSRDNIGVNWHLYTDKEQIAPIVNKILRYENLNEELGTIFNQLGVPWFGMLDVFAKGEYREDRRDYREVLSQKQIAHIKEIFHKECNFYDYKI